MSLALLLAALVVQTAHADPTPFPMPTPPDKPRPNRDAPPEPPPGVDFGSDFSVGYLAGALLAPWPEAGVHGFVMGRYDAFLVNRTHSGWRLGLSLWGGSTVFPLQQAVDRAADGSAGETIDVRYTALGAMTVLRPDPEAPIGPLFGLGLSRMDIREGYYGGPMVLPMVTFEGGARQKLTNTVFLDWTVRTSWATARSGADPAALEEWWLIQGGLQVGYRVK